MGGAGVARVIKEVTFTVANSDVTNNLSQYGVTLGSDLAGAENKAMLVAGAGVAWPILAHLVVDLQYRYGRILTSGGGMNLSRAGIGIGVRF
jgi:opacity protein-like surface antigen